MAEPEIAVSSSVGQCSPLRVCSRCNKHLPATSEHFSFIKVRKTFHSWCKPCCAEDRRSRRAADPEHHSAIEKKRHALHGEKRRAQNRAAWQSYVERNADRLKQRRDERQDIYNESRRAKIAANPQYREAQRKANALWRERNRGQNLAARREAWAKKTPKQKLRNYFGASISHSIKGNTKGGKGWQEILGYTADDLRAHLERQFVRGMSWDNYGDWHIDHILPVASFDYESVNCAEFHACWALTNLRPMWAGDNIRKRDKRMHLI